MGSSVFFHIGISTFGFHAFLLWRIRGFCFPAEFRDNGGVFYKFHEFALRLLPVLELCPESVGDYDNEAVVVYSIPEQPEHPCLHVVRDECGFDDVEPELNRGGDLVDILSARPGCPDKLFLDLILRYGNPVSYENHMCSWMAYFTHAAVKIKFQLPSSQRRETAKFAEAI